jgi:hypothetical protein
MSLVRLLTAGKSLVGIQDSKSRYRSVDPRALPKFGSEKKVNTEVAGESGVRPSAAKSSAEGVKADVRVTADKNVRAPLADKNAGITEAAGKAPTRAARQDRGSGWVGEWGSKLSSLVSQKPKPTRSAIPRFNGVPVQGELSLDNIKVVRNDLSDADLEVVAKEAVKPEPEKAEPSAQERKAESKRERLAVLPARGKWELVTTMFSAVKS